MAFWRIPLIRTNNPQPCHSVRIFLRDKNFTAFEKILTVLTNNTGVMSSRPCGIFLVVDDVLVESCRMALETRITKWFNLNNRQ